MGDSTGDGCSDLCLVLGVGHGYFDNVFLGFGIRDLYFAADAVEFEGDGAHAVLIHFAGAKVLNDQGVAVGYIDLVGFADGKSVEEYVAAQAHDVAILFPVLAVILVDFGIEAVGENRAPGLFGIECRDLFAELIEINGRKQFAGSAGDGLFPLEHDFLQIFREAPRGLAHHTGEVGDRGIRERQIFSLLDDVLGSQIVLGHKDRQVADHLGGRGDLGNTAQQLVDLAVIFLDFGETLAKTHALDLGLEVGVLSAGDLIAVDIRGGTGDAALELVVAQAHIRPVVSQVLELVQIEACVSGLSLKSCNDSVHGRVGCQGRHGRDRAVHDVDAGLGCHQIGGHLVTGSVVGVQMDRNADLLAKR